MFKAPMVVEKKWGREEWLHNSPMYCGKLLHVDPGKECSLHYHHRKHETFYVLRGPVFIEVGDAVGRTVEYLCEEKHLLEVPPYYLHKFKAPLEHGAAILEISTQHDERDVVRQ